MTEVSRTSKHDLTELLANLRHDECDELCTHPCLTARKVRNEAADEIERLQDLLGAAYQLAGLVGAPVRFLDAFSRHEGNAENLLPVTLDECDEFKRAAVPPFDARIANEWADMAANGIQWLRNIRDGISTPAEALAEMEANCQRIRALRDLVTKYANPHCLNDEFKLDVAPPSDPPVAWRCDVAMGEPKFSDGPHRPPPHPRHGEWVPLYTRPSETKCAAPSNEETK